MKPVYSLLAGALVLMLGVAPACAAPKASGQDADSAQAKDQAMDQNGAKADEAGAQDQSKTLYALGLAISQGLAQFHLTEDELQSVQAGLADGVLGKEPKVDLQEYMKSIQELAKERAAAASKMERAQGADFLAKAAAEPGAVKTDSGLVYKTEKEGTGPSPAATDTVKVNYKGTLRDGTVFDSSYDRGQPATFPLNQVIPCWTEGVQHMKVGGKAKLVCPPNLAYGDRPAGKIPPGSTLVFEVELLDIVKKAEAPKTPAPAKPMSDSGQKMPAKSDG
jgi:FKBP-type peptidyl-prolyl cis-trans isomerase